MFNPVQTDLAYQAADGVNATFGDLDVRGLAVIAKAKDAPGAVIGQLVNGTDEDIDVAIASQGSQPVRVTVARHSSLSLADGEGVTLSTVAAAPGDVLEVSIATAATGQNVLTAPVLPALSYYEGIEPAPAPAPDSPSASPSTTG